MGVCPRPGPWIYPIGYGRIAISLKFPFPKTRSFETCIMVCEKDIYNIDNINNER
jgi:hypothetical protein